MEKEIDMDNIKFLEKQYKNLSIQAEEVEKQRISKIDGMKYRGLIIQRRNYSRDGKDYGDMLRIYAGKLGKKRYYSIKKYETLENIFALCDSIIKGER